MANNAKPKASAETTQEIPVTQEPVVESVYSAQELADNYKAFGTYREIVVVALRLAGKKSATFAEAKQIIEKFKNKEVK